MSQVWVTHTRYICCRACTVSGTGCWYASCPALAAEKPQKLTGGFQLGFLRPEYLHKQTAATNPSAHRLLLYAILPNSDVPHTRQSTSRAAQSAEQHLHLKLSYFTSYVLQQVGSSRWKTGRGGPLQGKPLDSLWPKYRGTT